MSDRASVGVVRRRLTEFINIMDVLHEEAFGEKYISQRFIPWPESHTLGYLPSSFAFKELEGYPGLQGRIKPGEDAFVLNPQMFTALVDRYAVSLSRIFNCRVPKCLVVDLLALHELRHKARWVKRVELFSSRSILPYLQESLPILLTDSAERHFRWWLHIAKRIFYGNGSPKRFSQREQDANLIEGVAFSLWYFLERDETKLIEKYFPQLILLGSEPLLCQGAFWLDEEEQP